MIEAISGVAKQALTSLPPAFIMLVFINALFLGSVMWFLDSQSAARSQLANRVLDGCLEQLGRARPPEKAPNP